MMCQVCKKRAATVHFTNIVQGKKTEGHACKGCASSICAFFGVDPATLEVE